MSQPLIVLIAGPSGVGKTTVVTKLRARGHDFHKAITATTRPPRTGEKHEVDYFFLSESEFNDQLAQGKFLENAEVFGHRYGVPGEQVWDNFKNGRDVILICDVQGAESIRAKIPGVISIFLKPTSFSQIEKKVRARETDPKAVIRRLSIAKHEISRANEFTHVVVNRIGKIEETLDQLERHLEHHRGDKANT